ncbi:MAG: sigma-54 dependent transcriptional regulator [Acidobacteria bacterium]|nr:sigma-54 dependent transcriptional regulator [Acidobacteriota bacterium]
MVNELRAVPSTILLVEDDQDVAVALKAILEQEGHSVEIAGSLAGARETLDERLPEIVLIDLGLPDGSGLDLLDEIRATDEVVGVIMLTGSSNPELVVECMKRGADHFLPKPVHRLLILETVARVVREVEQRRHVEVYRTRVASGNAAADTRLAGVIGSSAVMEQVRRQIVQVADTGASVILLGESGTGKGMLARHIHRLSPRASGPFVDVNCAAIQAQLVESEIFGHEKGAFTGAVDRKPGLLEVAHSGTLFLDEVADLDTGAQAKLLKAVEERVFRRVGGVRTLSVDVRLLAATHRDLAARVDEGLFRRDLYYRLNVFPISLPPLRERPGDVSELAGHFIHTLNPTLGCSVDGVEESAREVLERYPWPGNVRELHNVVERAMILAREGSLGLDHLPRNLFDGQTTPGVLRPLAEVEREHIEQVLEATGNNLKHSAEVLGISRSTLYAKLERYGLRR